MIVQGAQDSAAFPDNANLNRNDCSVQLCAYDVSHCLSNFVDSHFKEQFSWTLFTHRYCDTSAGDLWHAGYANSTDDKCDDAHELGASSADHDKGFNLCQNSGSHFIELTGAEYEPHGFHDGASHSRPSHKHEVMPTWIQSRVPITSSRRRVSFDNDVEVFCGF